MRRVASPAAAALRLHLGQPRRRPVDLDGLAPGVLGDQVRRRPGGHRATVGHDRDGVGETLGLLDVVRGHEDRDPLGAQGVDERPQLLANLRVEPDGGLVEQHEPRAVHERPRHEQAPAHPARELVHPRVAPVLQLGDPDRALDRLAPLPARHAVEVGEHAEVLLDGERRVEVVELRHRRRTRPAPPSTRPGGGGPAPRARPRRRWPGP